MSYFSLEEPLKQIGSVYKLVILASKRALELNEGAPKLITEAGSARKVTAVALQEIAQGKIGYKKAKGKE